jgi:hypothetical protein
MQQRICSGQSPVAAAFGAGLLGGSTSRIAQQLEIAMQRHNAIEVLLKVRYVFPE